ncbi:type II toxin-antitoxin system PemK/MazF family toxin [Rhodopseudomonas sp. HC1]|uniref:type II toxin-antitoxin system PemK/MazF family toxin n=1 Tax=Rhodopseudomonas infernalis TaxID=2897386 RepID=UPI001EE86B81|nr:type II toxin-antitoxin system PemK/MazF family toxin [Rhodopseudomonas infernalis]MCG6205476.1 type II toxin-antitoxin system PemK/MazF family toxin [Rhodopseudomonas infernalis]
MTRGDVVLVAMQGDYGKPRPAVVVQTEDFEEVPSVAVLPLTTDLRDVAVIRIAVEPSPDNGLLQLSQIMVDKITAVARRRVGRRIGRLAPDEINAVNRALAIFLGIV